MTDTTKDGGTAKLTLREHAAVLRSEGMGCNCDLDNWQPEESTGHSWVCRIHKTATSRFLAARGAA